MNSVYLLLSNLLSQNLYVQTVRLFQLSQTTSKASVLLLHHCWIQLENAFHIWMVVTARKPTSTIAHLAGTSHNLLILSFLICIERCLSCIAPLMKLAFSVAVLGEVLLHRSNMLMSNTFCQKTRNVNVAGLSNRCASHVINSSQFFSFSVDMSTSDTVKSFFFFFWTVKIAHCLHVCVVPLCVSAAALPLGTLTHNSCTVVIKGTQDQFKKCWIAFLGKTSLCPKGQVLPLADVNIILKCEPDFPQVSRESQ